MLKHRGKAGRKRRCVLRETLFPAILLTVWRLLHSDGFRFFSIVIKYLRGDQARSQEVQRQLAEATAELRQLKMHHSQLECKNMLLEKTAQLSQQSQSQNKSSKPAEQVQQVRLVLQTQKQIMPFV